MAVIFMNQPEAFGLAYNDNDFVFRSTNYTPTQRFKVMVLPSTYPTDPILATVRVWPRQATSGSVERAFYDPSRILQTQLSQQIEIPGASHAGGFDANNIHFEYVLYVQEEDKVGGVYVGGASTISDLRSVWNGVENKVNWLDFGYDYYDMKSGNNLRRPLSQAPLTQYIDSNQSAFLYFLSSDNNASVVKVDSYDSNGAVLQSGSFSFSITNQYGYVAVGTYDLINSDASIWSGSTPSTIIDGAAYYDATIRSGGGLQATVRYYIDAKCSKYEPIRLHWLNKLGGFDSFNFNLKSEEQTSIKRSTYLQDEHSFTGTAWKYEKTSRGTTDYNITTQDKLTVNTDYLTEEESVWMQDFATSPVVYQEIKSELIALSGKPKRIAKQTSLNDKLMQYTFELEYSLNNNRQRG